MNRRLDDLLMRLAYGELDAATADRVRAEIARDPEAQARLATYAAMRSGLGRLGEAVPDDQMSRERLRHALLGDGLRPARREASGWSWAWMPVGAMALAAAFMLLPKPAAKVEPRIVAAVERPEEPRPVVRLAVTKPPVRRVVPPAPRPALVAVRTERVRPRRARRTEPPAETRTDTKGLLASIEVPDVAAIVSTAPAPTPAEARKEPPATPAMETVVIVEPAPVGGFGAASAAAPTNASEVTGASVLVGG